MIKHKYSLLVGLSLLLFGLSACGDSKHSPLNDEVQTVSTSALRIAGNTDNAVHTSSSVGESFFVKVNSGNQWQLRLDPSTASEWISLSKVSGEKALDEGIALSLKSNSGSQREAKLILETQGQEKQEILIVQQGTTSPTTPPSGGTDLVIPAGEHIHGMVNLLEVPRLMGGSHMYFVTHKTSDGKVNYSLEYDVNKRHARWVAFSWDKDSSRDATGRSDAWAWDPIIPSRYSTEKTKSFPWTGFSRGHLVASNDRQQSTEANKQTFYYTNMSPQRQNHNEGVWLELEQLLQGWARSGSLQYDAIYVAKGGTIADDQIEASKMNGLVVVPKYYWMAVLVKHGEQYRSIGFWTEHLKPKRLGRELKTTARSIDELEQLTGIDLFPNLEDNIEQSVEAQAIDAFRWPSL